MLMVKITSMPASHIGKYSLKRDLKDPYVHQGLLKWLKPSICSVAVLITILYPSYYRM